MHRRPTHKQLSPGQSTGSFSPSPGSNNAREGRVQPPYRCYSGANYSKFPAPRRPLAHKVQAHIPLSARPVQVMPRRAGRDDRPVEERRRRRSTRTTPLPAGRWLNCCSPSHTGRDGTFRPAMSARIHLELELIVRGCQLARSTHQRLVASLANGVATAIRSDDQLHLVASSYWTRASREENLPR
jgi:hypothetical protein